MNHQTPSTKDTSATPTVVPVPSRRLNIGCGKRFHRDWVNIDLDQVDPCIIPCDVTSGLPFENETFDAVYHSHILEHLDPEDGQQLIAECYRVLRPGGVLRIVVPDLEQIAKLYLEAHQNAWAIEQREDGDKSEQANYDWMKLELLDQMVRDRSGGQMGRYMTNEEIANEEFVRSRLGDEFLLCKNHSPSQPEVKTFTARIGESVSKIKKKMTRKIVRLLMGQEAQQAFDEGLFRRQGEVHRWMYDRFSLKKLCVDCGFHDFRVCDSTTSLIDNFTDYELDSTSDKTRKPDSLFCECVKL